MTESPLSLYLDGVEAGDLTHLVQQVLQDTTVTVQSWDVHPLTSGRSGASVCRLTGQGENADGVVTWSLICKLCTHVRRFGNVLDVDDPAWKREALLGESGLLDDIPSGLEHPRWLGNVHLSPTEIVVWFEDIGNDWAESWPVDRFGLAAFHLGQFNAHYADRAPSQEWLARNQWRRYVHDYCPDAVDSLRRHQDHPDVLDVYPRPLQERLYALCDDCDNLIARCLRSSSLTLCHGDTGGRNLFDREGQTVAIDWDEVGVAPLGEDVARMVGSSLHWFFIGRMDQAPALTEVVLARYLDGLRDAGWRGDPAVVTSTYRAVIGTIYALSYTGIANGIVEQRIENRARNAYKTTPSALLAHMGAISWFCVDQGEQAQRLV